MAGSRVFVLHWIFLLTMWVHRSIRIEMGHVRAIGLRVRHEASHLAKRSLHQERTTTSSESTEEGAGAQESACFAVSLVF